jgi:hypothetical protein
MSEQLCRKCGKPHGPIVYICRGTNTRYVARVRTRGHRRYRVLGKPTKSFGTALRRMTEAFIADRHHQYKRGGVLMMADYYDPEQICELVRL